jgi:hypothetical protein
MRLREHFGRQSAAAVPRRGESARGKRTRSNPPGPTKCETLAIIEECDESEKFIPKLYEHDRSVDH